MAMMDMGAKFRAKSYWSNDWKNPKLSSKTGVHNHKSHKNVEQWWEVNMPGSNKYTFSDMTLMKRGDGKAKDRVIKAVRFRVKRPGSKKWEWHNDGKYYKTGQTKRMGKWDRTHFPIDPPIKHADKVRVYVDRTVANSGWYQGRFDLWAKKE